MVADLGCAVAICVGEGRDEIAAVDDADLGRLYHFEEDEGADVAEVYLQVFAERARGFDVEFVGRLLGLCAVGVEDLVQGLLGAGRCCGAAAAAVEAVREC